MNEDVRQIPDDTRPVDRQPVFVRDRQCGMDKAHDPKRPR
jgi:hypothetical protein